MTGLDIINGMVVCHETQQPLADDHGIDTDMTVVGCTTSQYLQPDSRGSSMSSAGVNTSAVGASPRYT